MLRKTNKSQFIEPFPVILSERSESKDPLNIATLKGILRLRSE